MPFKFINKNDLVGRRYLDFPTAAVKQVKFNAYDGVNFEHTSPFAVSFWLYNKGSAITRYVYWKYDSPTSSSNAGFALFIDSSRRLTYRYVDGTGGIAQGFFGGATASANESNHFLYVYKGGVVTAATNHICYVNGTRIAASASGTDFKLTATTLNNSPVIFGGVATNFVSGFIRDLIVFSGDVDSDTFAADLFGATLSKRTYKGLLADNRLLSAATLYCRMGDDYYTSGSTLLFPNRINTAYPGYSTAHTVSNIITSGTSLAMFTGNTYENSLEKVEFKNIVLYTGGTNIWSHNVGKTTNDGAYSTGSAQSTKKIVGDGRVHFFLHNTTALRHTYMGISDRNTAFVNPATVGNNLAFGAGNTAFLVNSGATLMFGGVTPAYRDLMTVESSGNSTIFFFKLNGVTQYTLTGCSFPNGWYVTPLNLYVLSLYRTTWDSWYDFTGLNGTLAYNNLI